MSQKRLLDEQKKSNSNGKMKTTLVILYIDGTMAKYGHIGDSRLYVVKNGKIQKRTIDHSVPQMLALAGEIREKDIRHHEDRNRLLRAMGNEWDDSSPKYEIDDTLDIEKGMSFLLWRKAGGGFERWLLETAQWAVSTTVALPQQSESTTGRVGTRVAVRPWAAIANPGRHAPNSKERAVVQ